MRGRCPSLPEARLLSGLEGHGAARPLLPQHSSAARHLLAPSNRSPAML
jgi:hypothetical protein